MKTVRDDDGSRYILLKRSGDASLVRDPETGNDCYVGNDRLEPVEGSSALETAASAVPEPIRRLITGVHDDRTLGLLVELADRGPLPVRHLIAETDYCESDLHGTLASLTAAALIEETTVAGERAYAASRECEIAVAALRECEIANSTLREFSSDDDALEASELDDSEPAPSSEDGFEFDETVGKGSESEESGADGSESPTDPTTTDPVHEE